MISPDQLFHLAEELCQMQSSDVWGKLGGRTNGMELDCRLCTITAFYKYYHYFYGHIDPAACTGFVQYPSSSLQQFRIRLQRICESTGHLVGILFGTVAILIFPFPFVWDFFLLLQSSSTCVRSAPSISTSRCRQGAFANSSISPLVKTWALIPSFV